jgi:D-Tyr-tRNAtyr deacylase
MSLAPERLSIGIKRHFTSPGVHPYDQVVWEHRDARISNWKDGSVAFEQLGVEFPASWSLNATNIVAQKYFRGSLGTPERETSLRQVIDRVAETITTWGVEGGYFADDTEAQARKLAEKVWHLRVMDDDAGVMNRSLADTTREVLVVSQFTLYGDTTAGRRPVDRGDHWAAQVVQALGHSVVAGHHQRVFFNRHRLGTHDLEQVTSAAKNLATAAQHHRLDGLVLLDLGQGIEHLGREIFSHGVGLVRPIHCERGHGALACQAQLSLSHHQAPIFTIA